MNPALFLVLVTWGTRYYNLKFVVSVWNPDYILKFDEGRNCNIIILGGGGGVLTCKREKLMKSFRGGVLKI